MQDKAWRRGTQGVGGEFKREWGKCNEEKELKQLSCALVLVKIRSVLCKVDSKKMEAVSIGMGFEWKWVEFNGHQWQNRVSFQSMLMISANQVNIMQNNEPKRTAQSIKG